jgi:hydrogenase/urease accessory protein HupE
VTATWEEILVAATAAGRGNTPLDERVRRHGEYLLSRLTVEADGRPLAGAVVATPPASEATAPFTYTFSYRSSPSSSSSAPQAITLRNHVLREIGLALGGPWEVSYLVTVTQNGSGDGAPRLLGAEPVTISCNSAAAAGGARLALAYLRQGILHILRGYDHLLFVAALVLAAVTLRDLIKVVVAFTLAHATTLTLCALRLISIRESIVEPLIAASIVVVALQNVFAPASSRRAPRLVIAFAFGLLHGCGFASGALQAMRDLPAAGLGLAVGAFSLGVEIGHQAIVIPTFMLLNRLRERATVAAMAAVQRAGSAAIAVAGGVYLWLALHR